MSKIPVVALIFILVCCSPPTPKERGEQLFNGYCASCHIAPSIQDLPKNIWAKNILPEMGARLGVLDSSYNPYKRLTFVEKSTIKMENIYPEEPVISMEDWELLKGYVLGLAPDSLAINYPPNTPSELSQFSPEPIAVDSLPGSLITFMHYDESSQNLDFGDIRGNIYSYDFDKKQSLRVGKFGGNVVDYPEKAWYNIVRVSVI